MTELLDVGTPLKYHETTVMFVEMPAFAAVLSSYIDDNEFREFQEFLAKDPEAGDLIEGTHGLRKIRWKLKGIGKRGGVRILYYWVAQSRVIVLAFMYSKARTGDLTKKQYKAIADYVRSAYP